MFRECCIFIALLGQPTAPATDPKSLPVPSNVPQTSPDGKVPVPPQEEGGSATSYFKSLSPGSQQLVTRRAKWVFQMPDGVILDYWPVAKCQDLMRRFVRFDPPPRPKKGTPSTPSVGGPSEVLRVQESPETLSLQWADSIRQPWGAGSCELPYVSAWRDGKETNAWGQADPPHLFLMDPMFRPAADPFAKVVLEVAPGIFEVEVKSRHAWNLEVSKSTLTVRLDPEQFSNKQIKLKEFFYQSSDQWETVGGKEYHPGRLVDADKYRMSPERLAQAVAKGELRLIDWKVQKVDQGKGARDYRWTPEHLELQLNSK